MSKLTKEQQEAIRLLRKEGADFTAGAAERFWRDGRKYYLDKRAGVSKATRAAFNKANRQAGR